MRCKREHCFDTSCGLGFVERKNCPEWQRNAPDRIVELQQIAEQAVELVNYAYATMAAPREMPAHVKAKLEALEDRLYLRERTAEPEGDGA